MKTSINIERLKQLKTEVEQLTQKAKSGNPFTIKETLNQLADKQNEFMSETVSALEILAK